MTKKTSLITINGLIAALYAVLTLLPLIIPSLGQYLYGTIQFRISELLCILPFFIPSSYWGLFIGCAVANYIGMSFGFTSPIDIVIGSLATLIAAFIASKIKNKWLVPLPTVVFNAVIIGIMLTFLYPMGDVSFFHNALIYGAQVGFGELVVCYGLGIPFLNLLLKRGFCKNGIIGFTK